MDDVMAQDALKSLSALLNNHYQKKVIILLDEYDTPLQEAYSYGYWEELTGFMRSFFNSAFKTNPYMERAVMTGITRISKESMFSDLNNLNVVTTTAKEYESCFGFTESEVFQSLELFGLSKEKQQVKQWYDGFIFGSQKDIYNPWSITNFLSKREYQTYWTDTSSNALVSKLIQTASAEVKEKMEELLQNNEIVENFDEQIIFHQLTDDESAIWSLLMASGYLKAEKVEYRDEDLETWYYLKITNKETHIMFSKMFKGWFRTVRKEYNEFITALLGGNVKNMTNYLNDVALETFSNFDAGRRASARTQPERFYHGFVLGLLVALRKDYQLKSNRESGYGRYDVMLIPKHSDKDAIIMKFKVFDSSEETGLEGTAKAALKQIEEKGYDTELLLLGIPKEKIRHYGFAFEGKRVLIETNTDVITGGSL